MQETQETTIQEFESNDNSPYERYSEYEEPSGNNLQKVPAHWEERSFQYWAGKKNDKGGEKERDFITLEHINSVTGDLVKDFEWERKKSEEYYRFESGDVLFGKLRPYLRKYYQVDREGCCGTDLMVLRPKSDVKSRFLYYFLHSEDFIQFTDANSHGVKMPRTSWRKISSAHFRLPPVEEQEAIIGFLDEETQQIDKLIEKKEDLSSFLKEKKNSIVSEVVTQGLNPHAEMEDSGVSHLGAIPEGWDTYPIKRISQPIKTGSTPSTSNDEYYETDEVPWYSPESISTDFVVGDPSKYISNLALEDGAAPKFEKDSVLMVIIGATVGKLAYLDTNGSANQQIKWIKFDEDHLDNRYAAYQLKTFEDKFRELAPVTTVPILDEKDIDYFEVAVPPKKEQNEILDFLDEEIAQIDCTLDQIQKGIDRLKEYRTTLITEAVTGQIDVRGEV